jgi:hypothetical protein
MNVKDGLQDIRARLIENGASKGAVQTVDAVITRASLPAAQSATAPSLLQLVRMLMRSSAANADPVIYNDFVRIESDLESRAEQMRAVRDAEDAKPIPKTKKFYKNLKDKKAG